MIVDFIVYALRSPAAESLRNRRHVAIRVQMRFGDATDPRRLSRSVSLLGREYFRELGGQSLLAIAESLSLRFFPRKRRGISFEMRGE